MHRLPVVALVSPAATDGVARCMPCKRHHDKIMRRANTEVGIDRFLRESRLGRWTGNQLDDLSSTTHDIDEIVDAELALERTAASL